MNSYLNFKYFVFFSFAFTIAVIAGTLSHELGHVFVAKYLGYETKLSFASMNYDHSELSNQLKMIYDENQSAIDENNPFDQKATYERLLSQFENDQLWIAAGGVIQTILTGTLGFIFLLMRRTQLLVDQWKLIDWLAVFLALFWSREIINLAGSVSAKMLFGSDSYFGGDEYFIANMLGIWQGTLSISLGFLGLIISYLVIFKIIPSTLRFTFIVSGFCGGFLGMVLWMLILGPILLPF